MKHSGYIYSFCCLRNLALVTIYIYFFQLKEQFQWFAGKFPQFFLRFHFLFLLNHLPSGYGVLISLQGLPFFQVHQVKVHYLATIRWCRCHAVVYGTLLSLCFFHVSFPSFLEMLLYLALVRLFLFLALLTWCYYLWFPELINLFVNLCQQVFFFPLLIESMIWKF